MTDNSSANVYQFQSHEAEDQGKWFEICYGAMKKNIQQPFYSYGEIFIEPLYEKNEPRNYSIKLAR